MTGADQKGKIAIVTDSIAQVPEEFVKELGIYVSPLVFTVEGETFTDNSDFDPQMLYRRMRVEKDLKISTASPSIDQFQKIFRQAIKEGAESVLYVGISSRISSTIGIAETAMALIREEFPDLDAECFDTRLAAIAEGFLVIKAARMAARGATLGEILACLRQERRNVGLVASLETLDYLARGGRINKASYFMGSMINILPILTLGDDGKVAPVGLVRSHQKAFQKMVDYIAERVEKDRTLAVGVMHADTLERANQLKQLVETRLHPENMILTSFTPVMAIHTGPGLIGLAYYWQ
jgi:fatty acid kinase fatty acid binding subunit